MKTNVSLDDAFYEEIVKKAFNQIGYPEAGFERGETFFPDEAEIHTYVSTQSPDITMGVVKTDNEIGAGDQGMMFGYASSERADYMPIAFSIQMYIYIKWHYRKAYILYAYIHIYMYT